MFGYITINRPELRVKELETYEGYYCGLCSTIRKHWGILSTGALTYDMTFLYLLHASLYEDAETKERNRCLVHPMTRRLRIYTESANYAADMNFMLTYHNLADDWVDDKKLSARFLTMLWKKRYHRAARKYPRQHKAMVNYVHKLHACEKAGESDVEKAASLTGECFAEVYCRRDDEWASALRTMGYQIGKFIYLMDAYEDVEKDLQSGSYNPFKKLYTEGGLTDKAEEYLKLLTGSCCRAFELLPILRNAGLLRNILYSGVWVKFSAIAKKRRENKREE